MELYKIDMSENAAEDLKEIISYIKNDLKVPITANKFLKLIKQEISSLKNFPKRNASIDSQKIEQADVRKQIIKNYIVFYIVDDEKKIISIERIMYGASDWKSNL